MRDPWESDEPVGQPMSEPESDFQSEQNVNEPIPSAVAGFTQTAGTVLSQRAKKQPAQVPSASGLKQTVEFRNVLQFNRTNLIQGVIWAEILGKPKARSNSERRKIY
jgi:hypothetical protein